MKQLRPILFSTPMVQAILEGRKTQTRRVVKGEHLRGVVLDETMYNQMQNRCPYGQVGDVLWVRETFNRVRDKQTKEFIRYGFKATDTFKNAVWNPSIYMPFEAARIFLKITDVRVERLQDITQQDSISEGIECIDHGAHWKNYDLKSKIKCYLNANHSFESLWQSINGKDSWNANPWVWVVEFKHITKEKALQ